jgi:hypothetical protein
MVGWLEFAAIALAVVGVVAGIDWLLQLRSWKVDRGARNQQVWDQWDALSSSGMSDARNHRRRG